jgi:dihydrofolate reductase
MARVILDMSPSSDGFVAGSGITPAAPFGDAGPCLHRWIGLDNADPEPADRHAAHAMLADAGAVVIGRRMFEVGIAHWGEDGAFERPTVVVTHRPRADLRQGATTFLFETGGVAAAIDRARDIAQTREVVVAGGAELARQCLAMGLIDALRLHVVPIRLGHGARLLDEDTLTGWRLAESIATRHAVHRTYFPSTR